MHAIFHVTVYTSVLYNVKYRCNDYDYVVLKSLLMMDARRYLLFVRFLYIREL